MGQDLNCRSQQSL